MELYKGILISIITVVKDDVDNIEKTLNSINDQIYDNFEHIIIDGDSSDGTQKILKNYQLRNENCTLVIGKDSGMYDALNKGYSVSNGEIVGILNSGDYYKEESYLMELAKNLKKSKINGQYIIQTHCFTSENNLITKFRSYKPSKLVLRLSGSLINTPHTSMFFSKELIKSKIKYDVNLKSSSDFKFVWDLLNSMKVKAKKFGIYGPVFVRDDKNLSSSNVAKYENKKLINQLRLNKKFLYIGKLLFVINNLIRIIKLKVVNKI